MPASPGAEVVGDRGSLGREEGQADSITSTEQSSKLRLEVCLEGKAMLFAKFPTQEGHSVKGE